VEATGRSRGRARPGRKQSRLKNAVAQGSSARTLLPAECLSHRSPRAPHRPTTSRCSSSIWFQALCPEAGRESDASRKDARAASSLRLARKCSASFKTSSSARSSCLGEAFSVDEAWLRRMLTAPSDRRSSPRRRSSHEPRGVEAALAASRGEYPVLPGAAVRWLPRQTLDQDSGPSIQQASIKTK